MKHTIEITIRKVEGAIIRTLCVIERRGFVVRSINTTDSACDDELAMVLAVESPERSVEVLKRHIEKLIDVCAVQLAADVEELPLRERVAC